jgi:hypothetical protein
MYRHRFLLLPPPAGSPAGSAPAALIFCDAFNDLVVDFVPWGTHRKSRAKPARRKRAATASVTAPFIYVSPFRAQ